MREKLRKDVGNNAQFWIPIETSLLIQYNFVTLMPHSRYIYVAILLHCGATGTEEIPTDSRFLANIFGVDERTISKSLDELENANLLTERKKDLKEEKEKNTQTDEETGVPVESQNLSQNEEESQSNLVKGNFAGSSNGNQKHSQFSIEECLRYVEKCKISGDAIQNPKALASHLFKSGEADAFIMATLYPAQAMEEEAKQFGEPIQFHDKPCGVCFGAKMADADGKGYRACEHCRNERGKSTGLEPEGENNDETIY
ncbi:MAG: hypothetical protein H0U50_05470 [Pyrinomonadaceae bacterium]|nr:hypothetical protein [Pyrinomonadaceae bacterium]